MRPLLLSFLTLGCCFVAEAAPQAISQTSPNSLDWDHAFADHSGTRPLHFTARYTDARGPHTLEVWRTGHTHLRRRTDDRIDLHADAQNPQQANQPDYLWQIIDLPHHIDNRISSHGLLQAGLLYNFYAMAHVLTRPAGHFQIELAPASPTASPTHLPCTWYKLTPEAQPATRICWSPTLGIPIATQSVSKDGTLTDTFTLLTYDHNAIPSSTFAVNLKGLTVRDHDALASDD